MEAYAVYLILGGLGLVVVGFLWLVIVACLQWGWWNLIPPLFLFTAPIMILVRFKRAWIPYLVIAVGVGLVALPAGFERIYRYFVPIDLGPRDKMVTNEETGEQERHITLTGWDQNDYSVLKDRQDVAFLQMANKDVTDETMSYLAAMKKLHTLDVSDSAITDAGLEHLRNVKTLKKIMLKGTKITDKGLASLVDLPNLKSLVLSGTKITDKGVEEHLTKIDSLMSLGLGSDTAVTRAAANKWRKLKKGRRTGLLIAPPKRPTPKKEK